MVRSRIQFPDSRSSALSMAPMVLTHWVFVTLHPAWTFWMLICAQEQCESKGFFLLETISLSELISPLSLRFSAT